MNNNYTDLEKALEEGMKQEKDSMIIQLFEHNVSLKNIHDMSNLKYEEIGKILDDYYDKKNKSSKSR